jgi:hypothetical protein
MLGKFAAALSVCCLTSALLSPTLAAETVVKPSGIWSGKIKDKSLRKIAPPSGFIADARAWKKVWKVWRNGEDMPKIDFTKHLILVGTVPGPNQVVMQPTVDASGNLKFIVKGTEIFGKGFGYKLIKIERKNVKTVNGKAIGAKGR